MIRHRTRSWLLVLLIPTAVLLLAWIYSRYVPDFTVSGKLLDQDGKPIGGAELVFESWERRTLVPYPLNYGYRSSVEVRSKTNSQGEFSVGSPRERLRLLEMRKPGYVLGPMLDNFSRQESEPNHWSYVSVRDVLILAYDDRAPWPSLSVKRLVFDVPLDGTRKHLVFGTGEITDEPDLADMSLWFEGEMLRVTVHGGGIWLANNEFMYAPAEDYVRDLECEVRTRYPHWSHGMLFYSRSGTPPVYGRGSMRIRRDDRKPGERAVDLQIAINPTGSRDLRGAPSFPEPDVRGGLSERVRIGRMYWWDQVRRVRVIRD